MKITKSQLKQIIKEELDTIYERKGRRGISPMYRMATGGGGAYSPSDDSVVDFLTGMVKDKIEDYRKKQKEKEDRINPELTDKYMKKAACCILMKKCPVKKKKEGLVCTEVPIGKSLIGLWDATYILKILKKSSDKNLMRCMAGTIPALFLIPKESPRLHLLTERSQKEVMEAQ